MPSGPIGTWTTTSLPSLASSRASLYIPFASAGESSAQTGPSVAEENSRIARRYSRPASSAAAAVSQTPSSSPQSRARRASSGFPLSRKRRMEGGFYENREIGSSDHRASGRENRGSRSSGFGWPDRPISLLGVLRDGLDPAEVPDRLLAPPEPHEPGAGGSSEALDPGARTAELV